MASHGLTNRATSTTRAPRRDAAHRLVIAAVLLGAVIAAGVPLAYQQLQAAALQRDAAEYATLLADTLRRLVGEGRELSSHDARSLHGALLRGVLSASDVSGIRVLDDAGRPVVQYAQALAPEASWRRATSVASAPLSLAGRSLGRVEVRLQQDVLGRTVAVWVVCALAGGATALFVSSYALRVTRRVQRGLQHIVAQVRRRAHDAETQLAISRALTSTLELGRLLAEVARQTAIGVGVDRCSIVLWRDARIETVMAQFADGHRDPALWETFRRLLTLRVGDVPAFVALTSHREPLVVRSADVDAMLPPAGADMLRGRTLTLLPLRRTDHVVGALLFDQPDDAPDLTRAQRNLAISIAGQVALAVDNIRSYHEAQRQLRTTASLLAVSGALGASLEIGEVARRAAREMTRLVGADTSIVFDLDAARMTSMAIAGYRVPPELRSSRFTTPFGAPPAYVLEAVRSGQPVCSVDVVNDSRFDHPTTRLLATPPRSVLCTPVISRGRPRGAVLSYWWNHTHECSPEELRVAAGVAGQLAVALENAQLYAERSKEAQVEERRRLADEIHDGIAQVLVAARQHLDTSRDLVAADRDQAMTELGTGIDRLDTAITEIRRVLFALRPSAVESVGLVEALRRLLTDAGERARWRVKFTADLGDGTIPEAVENAVFRIAQEALGNAVEHAEANHVTLTVRREDGWITLDVTDDGMGLTLATRSPGRGAGLASMHSRAASLGGSTAIRRTSQGGVRVAVRIPLPADGPAA